MTVAETKRASFTRMTDGTADDWKIIGDQTQAHVRDLPDRILAHLQLLKNDFGGFAIDRLEHCLQTATRALADGRDDEYVVCALIHDIGDTLGPMNHDAIAAAILEPFVSERNHWIVKHHGIFQGYYFFEYFGLDRDMRDRFKDHEYYADCEEFCRKYDQNSFDPDFKSMRLAEFEPMLRKVFAEPKNSIYLPE